MIPDLLKPFQNERRLEPFWFLYFRAICIILSFTGFIVYFVVLLMELRRHNIYIVASQVTIGEDGYNATVPIPDFIIAENYLFSNQNTNVTCVIRIGNGNDVQKIVNCTGILETVNEAPGRTLFYPMLNNPLTITDSPYCQNTNCSDVTDLAIAFQIPPTDPTIETNYTAGIVIGVSNTYRPSYKSDSSPVTYYNLGYGEVLSLMLTWSKYIPINGDPYYVNVQTGSTRQTLDPIPKTDIGFQYSAQTMMIYTEKYDTSISTVLGLIGGLYGGITTVFILLFGMTTITPWGILPKYFFRQSIARPLREEYSVINPSNKVTCPLVDPMPPLSLKGEVTPERFAFFKARLGKLESLLAKYYMDIEILESHAKYKKENHGMDV